MPAPTTYTSQELTCKRGDLTIYGQLFLPLGKDGKVPAGPLPTVACGHGFGANYLHCVPYAWDLAEAGYAVYCFDFCGGGYASRSDGNPIDMTIDTEREDFLAVIDLMRAQDAVDNDNLFLLGEGQGGLVATMAAHERARWVKGLILLYPAFQLHDDARRTFPTPKNIPVSYRQLGMRVGREYGEAAWNDNPYTLMRDFPGDVLILHGDEDSTALVEYSERAAEVFPHAELRVIRGARHAFRERTLQKALGYIKDFLAEETKAKEPAAEEPGYQASHMGADPSQPPKHAATRRRYNPDFVAKTVEGRHFRQR